MTISLAVAAAGGMLVAACGQQPAAPQKAQKCGSAVTHFLTAGTQVLSADHGALTCFATHARACRAATLTVTAMGVDAGFHYLFTIRPGGSPCQVTERRQSYSVNFGGSSGPASTVTCTRAGVTGSGVTLRCGGQEVLIPAKTSAPVPAAG